jgi:large subunit ribosomal protein L7Ae
LLNDVVALIKAKKAELLVIAHNVLPELCCKMGVPYIIMGKARLSTVVHKKTAAVLVIQVKSMFESSEKGSYGDTMC